MHHMTRCLFFWSSQRVNVKGLCYDPPGLEPWHLILFWVTRNLFLSLSGIHHWRVLPSELEGWASVLQRSHGDAAAEQPPGQQYLDSRYLLPERQEIHCSQHDHAQQAAEAEGWWHFALHHEVDVYSHGCCHFVELKNMFVVHVLLSWTHLDAFILSQITNTCL